MSKFWGSLQGCRPFQILYLPALLYLIYNAHKAVNPEDKIIDIIKKRYLALVPMAVIALSYMILNSARFGNITEFGHNYLPEFTNSELGQFNLSYIKENIGSVFRLPSVNSSGIWEYPQFNGMCIFLISPIVISYIVYTVKAFALKQETDKKLIFIIIVIVILEILCITSHKTMGGSHFGNRYMNDILPAILLGTALLKPSSENKYFNFNYILFLIGITLNIVGTVGYFCNFFS